MIQLHLYIVLPLFSNQMKDLKRQLVSERRRAEKLQDRLQEVLSDSRTTCNKSRSRGFQYQTIVIWYYDHFVPKLFHTKKCPYGTIHVQFCTIKKICIYLIMHKAVELNILLNIFVHVHLDPKMCFIVRFISFITRCGGFIGW